MKIDTEVLHKISFVQIIINLYESLMCEIENDYISGKKQTSYHPYLGLSEWKQCIKSMFLLRNQNGSKNMAEEKKGILFSDI